MIKKCVKDGNSEIYTIELVNADASSNGRMYSLDALKKAFGKNSECQKRLDNNALFLCDNSRLVIHPIDIIGQIEKLEFDESPEHFKVVGTVVPINLNTSLRAMQNMAHLQDTYQVGDYGIRGMIDGQGNLDVHGFNYISVPNRGKYDN